MSIGAKAISAATGAIKAGGSAAMKDPGATMAVGMAVGMTGFDVNRQLKEGNSLGSSLFKAGVENALYVSNPVLMTAIDLAPLAVQGAQALKTFRRSKAEQRYDARANSYGRIGNGYTDTMQAQTMRQAAVQQIQGNKLNARSSLGGEARIFAANY